MSDHRQTGNGPEQTDPIIERLTVILDMIEARLNERASGEPEPEDDIPDDVPRFEVWS